MNKYMCGVPSQYCSGTTVVVNHALRGVTTEKVHSYPEDAFKCHARYLVKVLGYTRVGNREFVLDSSSPIRVLTKKSRFGGRLRQGKREKTQRRGARVLGEASPHKHCVMASY